MFSGAFLFRKAKIQKAIKQERWEKMDYQMFKEQLAALLKRKAGCIFQTKLFTEREHFLLFTFFFVPFTYFSPVFCMNMVG